VCTTSFSAAAAGVVDLDDSWASSSAKASLTLPWGRLSNAWSFREPRNDRLRNSFWAAILSSSSFLFRICSCRQSDNVVKHSTDSMT
jgi:hypothetical protein